MHGVVDGPVGREAADYLERTVRMRPLAWGDSFGFRQVVTRSRDVTEPGQLAGLKIRTIQSPIYVKAVELMGASPTPMAFGEVYTSLQTGVIDGYEHDASTTLQQRFYEVAALHGAHAPHRRRARALGVDGDAGRVCPPTSARVARAGGARGRAAAARDGPARGRGRDRAARRARHDHPRHRRPRLPSGGRAALADAKRARSASRPGSRRSARDARRSPSHAGAASPTDRALQWAIAVLVVAQAAVVGLQVVGRHVLHQPIPWTEEIARLLLVWLMCVGGIAALRHGQHPRVTALVRLLSAPHRAGGRSRAAAGAAGVLRSAWSCPAWRLTVASAGERLPASGLSGAAISVILPVALLLMSGGARAAAPPRRRWRRGATARRSPGRSARPGVVLASVLVPLVAGRGAAASSSSSASSSPPRSACRSPSRWRSPRSPTCSASAASA